MKNTDYRIDFYLWTIVAIFLGGLWASHAEAQVRTPKRASSLSRGASPNKAHRSLTTETSLRDGTGTIRVHLRLGTPTTSRISAKVEGLAVSEFAIPRWPLFEEPSKISGLGYSSTTEPGKPMTSVAEISLAVPRDASDYSVEVLGGKSIELAGWLLPAPNIVGDSVYPARYEPSKYFAPALRSSIRQPVGFRGLTNIIVRLPLLEVIAAGRIKAQESIDFVVRFKYSSSRLVAAPDDPLFSSLYRASVANQDDLRLFLNRSAQPSSSPQNFDPAVTDWIDPNAPYIKLSVVRDALYRVTAAQLFGSSGVDISEWKEKSIRMFSRGAEVPIFVEVNAEGKAAAIEFYGKRLRGFGEEHYNVSTDTMGYWLTNSSKFTYPPHRFVASSASSQVATLDAEQFLHHERDYQYHPGDGGGDDAETIHRSDYVPGERYVWQIFRGPANGDTTRVQDTFFIGNPSGPATISALVRGISRSRTGDLFHRLSFAVNGQTISEVRFKNYESVVHTFTVAANLLREGANVLTATALDAGSETDLFYFDYWSIDYRGTLIPNSDTAFAKGQWRFIANNADAKFHLSSSSPISSYDLTQQIKLEATPSAGGYDVSGGVRDGDTIIAATLGSFLLPARIYGWNTGVGPGWNILRGSNAADYIIIVHPKFSDVANKLMLRRTAAGLRSMAVLTDEIYNAFDYGSGEPVAIRNFLKYAYHNYTGTPVSFVTLLGDGTYDPKFNLNNVFIDQPARTNDTSFVPTYGNPASDFYFTLVDGGDDIYTSRPGMVIARIPVATTQDADNFLRKLVEYESKPPSDWNKKFLFAIGGSESEHEIFMRMVQVYLTGILPPLQRDPLNIEPHFVERTVFTSTSIDLSHVPDLQREFREGRSLVYFTGHGATFITDLYFGDPALYRNAGLYPVFITLSCRTGAFAEPVDVTLNEAFLRTPDGGVVMTYGTTGYGEVTYDNYMSQRLFELLGSDELRGDTLSGPHQINMTALFTAAKIFVSELGGGSLYQNALLQYSILGDAAMGFALRPQPELSISTSDVQVTGRISSGSLFSLQDSVLTVVAPFRNFGYATDGPVIVSLNDDAPGRSRIVYDTLQNVKSLAEAVFELPLDTTWAGDHSIRIRIDAPNDYAEENENDNEAAFHVLVSGESAVAVLPGPAAVGSCELQSDSLLFMVLIPASLRSAPPMLEISDSKQFSNTKSYPIKSLRSGLAIWRVPKSELPSGGPIYWWRIALKKENGQPAEFSVSSFDVSDAPPSGQRYSNSEQLGTTIVRGLTSENSKLTIAGFDTLRYYLVSRGGRDSNAAIVQIGQAYINDVPIYSTARDSVRIGIAVLSEDGTSVSSSHEFLPGINPDADQQKRLVRELDSVVTAIPFGRRVIILTALQPFVTNFTNDTITVLPALRSLGADSGFLHIEPFSDYILFGRKGDPPGSAKEVFVTEYHTSPELRDTAIIPNRNGTAMTQETSVAASYKEFQPTGVFSTESDVVVSIIGQNAMSGSRDTLIKRAASDGLPIDLSGIDPLTYPKLRARLDFIRTEASPVSPEVTSIFLQYQPAAELAIDSAKFSITPQRVGEGEPVVAAYTVENLSCQSVENFPVYLLRQYKGSIDTVSRRELSLPGYATTILRDTVQSFGLQGNVTLTASLDPHHEYPEQIRFNDAASRSFEIDRDTSRPDLDVRFDDRHINAGDYVSNRPRISIKLFDDSPVRISDSSSLTAILRREDILINPILFSGTKQPVDFTTIYTRLPSGKLQAELVITPQTALAPGKYSLTVFGRDASENATDTLEFRFTISGSNGIEHVVNIPNPFISETDLTYVLRSDAGGEVNAYIYTVAGRKIRTLRTTSAHVGLNILHWDGRDEMGNEVANGTYLYRVTLRGQNPDGSLVEEGVTERAVKSR